MRSRPPHASGILAELTADGRQIVLSTAMVGDRDDFDIWRRRCKDWTANLERSLTYIYGEESADVFLGAVVAPSSPGGWRGALTDEHDRVCAAIEMLDTLSGEMRESGQETASTPQR